MVKNSTANEGDMSSVPGLGTEISHAVGQPSLLPLSSNTEPILESLQATTTEAPALQQEKSLQWEAHILQQGVAVEKVQKQRPSAAKNYKNTYIYFLIKKKVYSGLNTGKQDSEMVNPRP